MQQQDKIVLEYYKFATRSDGRKYSIVKSIDGYSVVEHIHDGQYTNTQTDIRTPSARKIGRLFANFRAAHKDEEIETTCGVGGWPLVQSIRYPGERVLACPKCGAQNVTMTCRYPAIGTAPGGRGRLGDPGTTDINRCNSCGFEEEF